MLEEALLEFAGALVLVTHDRYLLDRVSNVVLGLNGEGDAQLFADYEQWEIWRSEGSRPAAQPANGRKQEIAATTGDGDTSSQRKKLSYKDQREWDGIDERIAAAETAVRAAEDQVGNAGEAHDAAALTAALTQLEKAHATHDVLLERWLELSEKVK